LIETQTTAKCDGKDCGKTLDLKDASNCGAVGLVKKEGWKVVKLGAKKHQAFCADCAAKLATKEPKADKPKKEKKAKAAAIVVDPATPNLDAAKEARASKEGVTPVAEIKAAEPVKALDNIEWKAPEKKEKKGKK
jgi:hypothetical protein